MRIYPLADNEIAPPFVPELLSKKLLITAVHAAVLPIARPTCVLRETMLQINAGASGELDGRGLLAVAGRLLSLGGSALDSDPVSARQF
jgi:hypothetical protein